MVHHTATPSRTAEAPGPFLPRGPGARVVSALQALVFTAIWIAIGLALDLEPSLYIALGVPLVLGFQLLVRRRPVRDLWVRDGDPFRLGRQARIIAVVLGTYPVIALVLTLTRGQWVEAFMAACCLPGALAAGYAFTRLDYATWRPALRAAALAAVIGLGWMIYLILPAVPADASVGHALTRGLQSLLLYVPVCFILEEVSFRGALDAHVHHPGESYGWLTAIFVAALWALWHLPIDLGTQPLGDLILTLLVIHITIGVPLAYAWRRSGNLALPASVHALVDSVRDGLFAVV